MPELHVLDSTDPAQIKSIENQVDLAKTLFIVSSKSGSTLEPNIFKQYFFELRGLREDKPGSTSSLLPISAPRAAGGGARPFSATYSSAFPAWRRYSALSDFGLVPAAIMGVDVTKFSTEPMRWCMPAIRECRRTAIPAPSLARFWERRESGKNQVTSLPRRGSTTRRGSNSSSLKYRKDWQRPDPCGP